MENELQPILNIESAIEAILFAAGYPVRYDKLAEVLGIGTADSHHLVENMADHFSKMIVLREGEFTLSDELISEIKPDYIITIRCNGELS